MTKLPSMPFFPADFFADTAHISRSAAHAYLFLLGHAWLRDGALPNNDDVLARMAGFRVDRWRIIKSEVLGFWKIGEDGLLRNKRLTSERDYVIASHLRNKANGALGGRPKSLNYTDSPKPNGYFKQTEAKAPTLTPIKESLFNGKRQKKGGDSVYVKWDTPQWNAWENFYRTAYGKSPPKDSKGGWTFPSEWPSSEWPRKDV